MFTAATTSGNSGVVPGLFAVPHLIFTERISFEALSDILKGKALALHVRQYYSEGDAEALALRLLNSANWGEYQSAPEVKKHGIALYDCAGVEKCDYLDKVEEHTRRLHELVGPLSNPAHRVQIESDFAWPAGCTRLSLEGRKCFLGLPRAFSMGGEALPHTDRVDWDWPSPETQPFRAQLAHNTYLSLSEFGGELELWNFRPSREEYLARSDGGYGLRRDLLPDPDLVIRPEPGDLVVFDASRVHAVTASHGRGVRVTMSGFLGFTSFTQPLRSFS